MTLNLDGLFIFLAVVALCLTFMYCWSVFYRATVRFKDKEIKFTSDKQNENEQKEKERLEKIAKEELEEKLKWEKLEKENPES